MKTEIVGDSHVQLPEVGQPWCHGKKPDATVYVRIQDAYGEKALGYDRPESDKFYSLELFSGAIMYTFKTSYSITLLKPAEGDKLKFIPA